MTHDYKRHGTTTLFAALEMAEEHIMATCMSRHRHQEWIKFLNLINQQTPSDLDLHLIVDNYSTHKHPKVKAWFKRIPDSISISFPRRASGSRSVHSALQQQSETFYLDRQSRGHHRQVSSVGSAI